MSAGEEGSSVEGAAGNSDGDCEISIVAALGALGVSSRRRRICGFRWALDARSGATQPSLVGPS